MNALITQAEEYGITITPEMMKQFETYADFLVEYNKNVNLTAITNIEGIREKHFLDSIALLVALEPEEGISIIDIGTGAGFPGVPLKIVRPDLRLTLLDSLNKRLVFLEELEKKLGLEYKLIHGRAEQVSEESPFREGYDIAVSRAVTKLAPLAEYCIPYVSVGGYFVAYKGPDWEEDYESGKNAVGKLGGKLDKVHTLTLPDGSIRNLLVIKKISETPLKFPRKGINIAKNPL